MCFYLNFFFEGAKNVKPNLKLSIESINFVRLAFFLALEKMAFYFMEREKCESIFFVETWIVLFARLARRKADTAAKAVIVKCLRMCPS